ncbi:hypothetical protein C361_03389 [Cryptococcus neoformans Tu259-1]|uniref:Zn(2)-C6 fungal-type domain-containing protein n=1 Tax=Cryptococcus neoformans Tu259-1 TaxID=1230072 RepID=A0A854QK03_CRYNE|nr:hypothetical protein C353_03068 [Cryptococcus neoformans var. grubii AD1-83a]OXG21962.1 hypothetical protein C361_03389 [Cryptococcus neoformans var. grubii Tu259-1]OXG60480.1 hypothetical protein C354_03005 [Cryptococcus neoformans var. grubii MW-RSA1955]OXG64279.1 hypothetical protein C351_02790 [Cryptococcus neoformans var. grubii c8]OXG65458.1 hypothetical protein C352_03015 [Cryptococcus neoformans var. grubii CHC193]OXH11573.1 hypothetical protein C369_03042 [Cryptococcus neoformans v
MQPTDGRQVSEAPSQKAITPPPSSLNPSRKRRRRFSRSKGGCLRCKSQKKKCDQIRPICTRCSQNNGECIYPHNDFEDESPSPRPAIRSFSSQPATSAQPMQSAPAALSSVSASASTPTSVPSSRMPLPPQLFVAATLSALPISPPLSSSSEAVPPHPIPELTLGQRSEASNVGGSNNAIPDMLGARLGDLDWMSDASFFKAFTDVASVLPLQNSKSNTSSLGYPSGHSAEHTDWTAALLSVPIDCGPDLWASFVDSSQWQSRLLAVGQNEGPLLEHFTRFASVTVVVRDGQNSASQFYQDLATRATQENQQALMHAVLAVSAQHLSNLARKNGETEKAMFYNEEGSKQRGLALHTLRIALARDKEPANDDLELRPAVMLLLVLASILRGDGDIIASYLRRTHAFIHSVADPARMTFLPTCSALHSIYSGFHSVSRGIQVNFGTLFPKMDDSSIWTQRANDTVETLVGISRDIFIHFLRVHSFVIEFQTISRALERAPDDGELIMMQLELQSDCSVMEADLKDEPLWRTKWLSGCDERCTIAHEFYRMAIRVMILVNIFGLDPNQDRVQQCVIKMLDMSTHVKIGSEIGLTWPFIIITSIAQVKHRPACLEFIRRCQWKGSACPQIAEKMVETIWDRKERGMNCTWSQVALEMGTPLLI